MKSEKFMSENDDLGGELTDLVIGAAIEVHRELGSGLLESIYEEALCHELTLRGISFERQREVDVIYKDIRIKGQRLDLLVDGRLVVELKATSAHNEAHIAQPWSYLKATKLPLGLLLNFGLPTLKQGIKRIANSGKAAPLLSLT